MTFRRALRVLKTVTACSTATTSLSLSAAAQQPELTGAQTVPTRPKDDGEAGGEKTEEKPRDAKSEVPITAYAYDAKGAPEKTVGAYGYGLGLAASGQDTSLGGGVTAWGSPIDRLTIVGDAPRDVSGRFTPSVALIGRLLGGEAAGWALGALGKWKAEGFGVGPHGDEIESEIEGGFLVSFDDSGWHLDTNALAGFGTGPAGEADAEGRIRLGYDVSRLVWLGVDGQARVRLAGPKYLPNGRIWDFAAGPQVSVGTKHFFGAFTAGPATMGLVSDNVGFNAILSAGGAL